MVRLSYICLDLTRKYGEKLICSMVFYFFSRGCIHTHNILYSPATDEQPLFFFSLNFGMSTFAL